MAGARKQTRKKSSAGARAQKKPGSRAAKKAAKKIAKKVGKKTSKQTTKKTGTRTSARTGRSKKKAVPRVVPTGSYSVGSRKARSSSSAAASTHSPDQLPEDLDVDGFAPDAAASIADSKSGTNHGASDADSFHSDAEHTEEYSDHPNDDESEQDGDNSMSVGDHLEELRTRFFWMIGIVIGLSAIAGVFSNIIHNFLVDPYSALTGENLILQNVYGPMEIYIKVSVLCGIIVGFPALVFIVWGFVTPAVSRRVALYGHLAVASSALLFWTGIAVCWFYIFPLSLRFFFINMEMDGVAPVLSVERFYSFLFALHLAAGLAFQLPIVLIALGAFGILTVEWHKRTWRIALTAIYVSSAVITPPDPWSMLGVGTLLALLYVFSVAVVWVIERSRRNK